MSNDPAHAIPAMLDLWPRYALLVRPELAGTNTLPFLIRSVRFLVVARQPQDA
jgi:hypothetical protein